MKFIKNSKKETSPLSRNFNNDGINCKKGSSSKIDLPRLFKIITMILLSNVFFYLLLGSKPPLPKKAAVKIPIEKEHTRIQAFLQNSTSTLSNKTPISIYNSHGKRIINKAYIILTDPSEIYRNKRKTQSQFGWNSSSEKTLSLSPELFTIEVANNDLGKIIFTESSKTYRAYPFVQFKARKSRRKYEIIF